MAESTKVVDGALEVTTTKEVVIETKTSEDLTNERAEL